MVYRKQIAITPSTITNLTVVVKDTTFFTTLTLDDFTLDGDVLTGRLIVGDGDAPISIYSQGYEPIITTFSDLAASISLVPTSDYIKTSDGTNDYYVKDNYSRQFGNDLLDIVMTKADSSDIPTKTSDLTNDSGFITGITSSDVTTALGYTPYNSSNPNGYITSAALPTVNDATITFTQGGTTKGTITLNQSSNQTIALDAGSSGGGTWGSITGTLSDQTDLQNALNAKLNTSDVTEYTAAEVETLWGSI